MGLFRFLILFYFICCSSAARSVTDSNKVSTSKSSISNAILYRSSIDRFVDKLFDETDTNNDGTVSFEEAYVGCLLLYVQLNRQAPIPPPSRKKFLRIFLQAADKNKSNKSNALDKEEYGDILKKIVGRAFLRLTSHKIATLIGAPLLAEMIVRGLASRKDGFEALLRYIVPINFQEAVIPTLTSRAFHRGLWIVILVNTLGNIFLGSVTLLLDMSLPSTGSIHRRLKAFNMI